MKLDLKDFFLCGAPEDIAELVSSLVDDRKLRELAFEALYVVLDHQFVHCQTSAGVFKCIAGSGIGLRHSAVVASLYFSRVSRKIGLLPDVVSLVGSDIMVTVSLSAIPEKKLTLSCVT